MLGKQKTLSIIFICALSTVLHAEKFDNIKFDVDSEDNLTYLGLESEDLDEEDNLTDFDPYSEDIAEEDAPTYSLPQLKDVEEEESSSDFDPQSDGIEEEEDPTYSEPQLEDVEEEDNLTYFDPQSDDFNENDPIADSAEEEFSDESDTPEYNPHANPRRPSACVPAPLKGIPACNGGGPFFTAGALLWNVKQDGLAYTIKNNAPISYQTQTSAYPSTDARVKHFDFDGTTGLRAGIGHHSPGNKWDLELDWTWYQQNTHTHTQANSDQGLFAIWMAPTGLGNNHIAPYSLCLEAKAHWNLHYNVFDLDLGRFCPISRGFSIRLHGGARYAQINQDFRINYLDFPVPGFPAAGWDRVDIKLKNHFWGAGIRAGLDTAWIFWKSWSIFCNASYSLLLGKAHVSNREFDTPRGQLPILQVDLKNPYETFRSNFEGAIGIRLDWVFWNDRCHLAFLIGWEEVIWFNQNQLNHLINASNIVQFFKEHGDLGLSGPTFNVRFDF